MRERQPLGGVRYTLPHLRPLPAFGTTGQQPIQLTNQGIRISMYLEPADGRGRDGTARPATFTPCSTAPSSRGGGEGDRCPRIVLRRLAGDQYARVQTGSRNPAYVLPDVSVLRPGWKAAGTRGGMEAYRVMNAYPPGSSRDPYWAPALAALWFQSPTNPKIRGDVAVGWGKVGGEWTLWCHACEAQEDLGVAVLWREWFAVTGGFERFPVTESTVRVRVGGEGLQGPKSGPADEVPVDARLAKVDGPGRKGLRIDCCAPPRPHGSGCQGKKMDGAFAVGRREH
ncbi:hypothetical protein LY76DRAFT_637874 [Colletotrichum caudatum]|nr:hypothetical protein LY76DRAFT_637874 [Colletotrichum caudatum]